MDKGCMFCKETGRNNKCRFTEGIIRGEGELRSTGQSGERLLPWKQVNNKGNS
jgi:hypothetical protein